MPEILQWARGPMRLLTADCLAAVRITLMQGDVAMLIGSAREGCDAILLDVGNGLDGRRMNDDLFGAYGLRAAHAALKPAGILAVWSAATDPAFTVRLGEAGFAVEEAIVKEGAIGEDADHVVWFARKL